MDEQLSPPLYPVGPFETPGAFDRSECDRLIEVLARAPGNLKQAVAGLSDQNLDTRYKNWTIRQIVHHLADSHLHCYARVKWTVAEEHPTIKPYDESTWVLMPDSLSGPVADSLVLLEGLHARWVRFFASLSDEQFERVFFHPEPSADVSLWQAVNYYAWHARHHTGQIRWLRKQHAW